MANPSAAHEPSMEEILASIRQIISEDGEGSQAPEVADTEDAEATASETTGAESEPEPEEGTEPESAEAEAEPQTFEPTPEPEHSFSHGESMSPQYSGSAAEAEPYASYAAPEPSAAASRPDSQHHLLSPQSDQAVHGAFSALAHTILAQNARTLEDLVAEMLQPMLKSWLDENLPTLVERLVQEEIQRVSRGRS